MNVKTLRLLLLQLAGVTLVAAFAHAGEWQTDYEHALATAKETKKNVLLNFTGSDWCPPCIAMNRNVFSKDAFKEFAQKHLILVEVDFPQRKQLPPKVAQQNDRLARQYEVEQAPTMFLLGPDGKVLGKFSGYSGEGPTEIIAWIEKQSGKQP